jgi:hypothetical protein
MKIENFSKRTILTGAGWTRNWGGRLAAEVWQDLLGHRAIQQSPRLRELLLREKSFETALESVQAEPYDASEREAFKKALLDTFIAMDREIARIPDPWINTYMDKHLQGAGTAVPFLRAKGIER